MGASNEEESKRKLRTPFGSSAVWANVQGIGRDGGCRDFDVSGAGKCDVLEELGSDPRPTISFRKLGDKLK